MRQAAARAALGSATVTGGKALSDGALGRLWTSPVGQFGCYCFAARRAASCALARTKPAFTSVHR